jgi:uncharacterized membrane protein YesL
VVLFAIAYSFRQANEVGLNIGLMQIIWSINPFLLSVLDCKCLQLHKIIGFILLVTCAALISFADKITHSVSYKQVILTSMVVPVAQLVSSLLARWALLVKQADP